MNRISKRIDSTLYEEEIKLIKENNWDYNYLIRQGIIHQKELNNDGTHPMIRKLSFLDSEIEYLKKVTKNLLITNEFLRKEIEYIKSNLPTKL